MRAELFQQTDYPALQAAIRPTIEKNVCDQALLRTKEWRTFGKKTRRIAKRVQDDVEFFLVFTVLSQGLPFGLLNLPLMEETPSLTTDQRGRDVFPKTIDPATLSVDVQRFGGPVQEMKGFCDTLLNGGFRTLIVDLRKNGGGGLDSALPFGECIATYTVDAGNFVTNTRAGRVSRPPTSASFKGLPIAQERTTEAFSEALKPPEGRDLVRYPGSDAFKGKVHILTSDKNASTCEPIVDALQRTGRATIAGENTAGAMLSAALFREQGKNQLFLPIADYCKADL